MHRLSLLDLTLSQNRSRIVSVNHEIPKLLVVEVTTTLFNRIKAYGNSTWSVGVTANDESENFYADAAPYEYGLKGPVVVDWVVLQTVA